jgi:hypothetical protein
LNFIDVKIFHEQHFSYFSNKDKFKKATTVNAIFWVAEIILTWILRVQGRDHELFRMDCGFQGMDASLHKRTLGQLALEREH